MVCQWDDIRIFLTIVRLGSLPDAAKELKMAHPTVFRRYNVFGYFASKDYLKNHLSLEL